MAARIASLLPPNKRGEYKKDVRIKKYQKENNIIPIETMISPYYDPLL